MAASFSQLLRRHHRNWFEVFLHVIVVTLREHTSGEGLMAFPQKLLDGR